MHRFARVAGLGWFAVLSLVALQACTHHKPGTAVQHASTFITVHNVMPAAYQLYLEANDRHIQVGTVDALADVHIQVPDDMSYPGSRVVLVAIPNASGRTLREAFIANPGANIRIQLGR
jgi:hypothetical protein